MEVKAIQQRGNDMTQDRKQPEDRLKETDGS